MGARDELFVEVLRAYRFSGGLARESEITSRMRLCRLPALSRDYLLRCSISFEWARVRWWPRFQFDLGDMALRRVPAQVIGELSCAMDDWGMALWFIRPNEWIGNSRPIDLIDDRPEGVIGAARAARFRAAS